MKIDPVALFETEADPWGFSIPIIEGFKNAGYPCEYLTPASATSLDCFSTILLYGPMQSVTGIVERCKRQLHERKVVFWFTEQLPSPNLPTPIQVWQARCRYQLQRIWEGHQSKISAKNRQFLACLMRRAGRLRAFGEMIALHEYQLLSCLSVFTERHAQYFRASQIAANAIPMGYHGLYGRKLNLPKDIDVLFIGSLVDRRRKKTIAQFKEWCAEHGLKFVVFDGSGETSSVYGKRRIEVLNRARIFLNIFRQPWDDPTFRLLLAGANNTLLLTEKVMPGSNGPFQANVHFAECELSSLEECTLDYLAHPAKMEPIIQANTEFVTQQLTMDNQVERIITQLHQQ